MLVTDGTEVAEPAYMTPKEVAAMLNISVRWVAHLAEKGELQYVRPWKGANRQYIRASVEEFARQRMKVQP